MRMRERRGDELRIPAGIVPRIGGGAVERTEAALAVERGAAVLPLPLRAEREHGAARQVHVQTHIGGATVHDGARDGNTVCGVVAGITFPIAGAVRAEGGTQLEAIVQPMSGVNAERAQVARRELVGVDDRAGAVRRVVELTVDV